MKFLLFLLGVVFFFIFYLFSKISGVEGFFVGNLFWIANIYVFTALIFVVQLFFSTQKKDIKKTAYEEENEINKYIPSREECVLFIKRIFSEYIYYIACALFYVALYFIMQSLYSQADIPLLFLFLNVIVIVLYFLEHRFEVFQDLVRVNMGLISLYYIIVHALYIWWFSYDFSIVDMINIAAVFILLFILLYSKRVSKYFELLGHYFIAFSFLEILVLSKAFMWWGFYSSWILALFLWTWSLILTKQLQQVLGFPKKMLRAWGVFFLSLFVIISIFIIWEESIFSLTLIPLLVFGGWILYEFHEEFQNYWALTMGSVAYMWATYWVYSVLFSWENEKDYFYALALSISWILLFFEKTLRSFRVYDIYFFHILSLLVNLVWIFCFLFLKDVSILSLWILLLIESLYLFVSYYTISKIKTLW